MSGALIAGITASATFGLIDTFNFIFVEDSLTKLWKGMGVKNQQTIDILNSGVSSAISILVAVMVENQISRYFEVRRTATIDATGVIVGTIVALVLLKLFTSVFPDRKGLKARVLRTVMPGSEAAREATQKAALAHHL